jgi:hypothetical protein
VRGGLPPLPPVMLRPIRGYLIALAGGRCVISALNATVFPAMFLGIQYVPIVRVLPLWLWALAVGLSGLTCIVGGLLDYPRVSRIGLIASAAVTFTVGFGILLGTTYLVIIHHPEIFTSFAPEVGLGFIALAGADYTILCLPWRRYNFPVSNLPPRDPS